jgi:hypothetical protein
MAYVTEQLTADESRTKDSLGSARKLQDVGESLGLAAGKTVARLRENAALARQHAQQVTSENPLQFLALLAGVAAVAGFATRLWRSSGNA